MRGSTASRQRRGTVLLMVVGVLALLAVIAVAYVTIGRADRTTSTVVVRGQRIDDQSQAFADYALDVIGRDTFSTRVEPSAPNASDTSANLYRETSDFPDTDHEMVSDRVRAVSGSYRFRPEGTYVSAWTQSGPDRRRPSDPFLASATPTRYVPEQFSLPAGWTRDDALTHIDWAHISNFAPDGRFVSLHNLRDNFAISPIQMSADLRLFNWRTQQNGGWVPTNGTSERHDSVNAELWRPADWSVWQLRAYQPLVDRIPNLLPSDARHLRNQWADADGDGFADSRWIELVDAFDRNEAEYIIPRNSGVRYFFAARAIDTSGLVNVNTATDQVYAPGYVPTAVFSEFALPTVPPTCERYMPLGLTPADIDLRRLLSMSDFYYEYDEAYDAVPQPPVTNPAAAGDYRKYETPTNAEAGIAAYAALRHGLQRGVRFDPDDVVGGAGTQADALVPNTNRTSINPLNANPLDPLTRATMYDSFGVDPRGGRAALDQSTGSQLYRESRWAFGLDTELELRTFHGLNDPDTLSPLEQITSGRGGTGEPIRRYDPLRSNRPRALELQETAETSAGVGPTAPAMMLTLTDLRRLTTTFNGVRPIVDRPLTSANVASLSADDVKTDLLAIRSFIAPLNDAGEVIRPTSTADKAVAVAALFDGIFRSLAPFRDPTRYPDAWDPGSAVQRTLAYGHAGAELAARLAAHMAVNTADSMDADTPTGGGPDRHEPTSMTVTLTTSAGVPTSDTIFGDADVQLTIGSPPNSAGEADILSNRFIAYGIEPQPFLNEVSFYVMFTDATDISEGSTPDEPARGAGSPGPGGGPQPTEPIKISRERTLNNGDYLCDMLAFAITNPFEDDISLTDSNGVPRFYIEFAKRFYAIAELSPDGAGMVASALELNSGETRVFYALSPRTPEQVAARFTNAGEAISDTRVKEMIQAQLGSTPREAILMPMILPDTLSLSALPTIADASDTGTLAGQQQDMLDLMGESGSGGFSTATSPGERSHVRLWRVRREDATLTDRRSDILVDRLRDQEENDWLAQVVEDLDETTDEIDNTIALGEGDLAAENDNTGFSVVMWRSVRRPTDSTMGAGTLTKRGALPPWCIEAKRNNDYLAQPERTYNGTFGELGDLGDGEEFRTETGARFKTLDDMIGSLAASSAKFNDNMDLRAQDKRDNQIPVSASIGAPMTATGGAPRQRPYDEVAVQLHFVGRNRNMMLYSRVGDLLLPLAIGPFFDSALGSTGDVDEDIDRSWMTLSEAAALASDYWRPASGTYGTPLAPSLSLGLLAELAHEDEAAGTPIKPGLRRGALVLDHYVPYLNLDGAIGYAPDADQVMGAGVPAALNILSEFRTGAPVGLGELGLTRTANYARVGSYGGADRLVAGLVNINTAPLPVLRLLPGIAPDTEASVTTANQAWVQQDGVVPAQFTGAAPAPLHEPTSGDPDSWDIAATALAYRDKNDVRSRPVAPGGDGVRIEFAEERTDLIDPTTWNARATRTGIDGLRERAGFRSEGELGALVIRSRRSGSGGDVDNSIDRLGRDGAPVQHMGLSSALIEQGLASATAVTERQNDEVVDGTDEKVAILNAVINNVSVRSDTFCVWFVVHGYTPSDVEDLAPSDEMVPTVQKRYVMVVDRSNVTVFGERPRVLLFKELPYQ